MKTILKYVLIGFTLIAIVSCKKATTIEPKDNTEYYEVTTIRTMSIEEIKNLTRGKPCDILLKLKFSKRDTLFVGSVTFDKIGEKEISNTCLSRNCFRVKLNSELGNATEVLFDKIKFTENSIEGSYGCTCPTCDSSLDPFVATKK